MKYRLKVDKNQKAFEAAFPSFAQHFQKACARWFDTEVSTIIVSGKDGNYEWSIDIAKEEVEAYEEYDPNKWNHYPEVTPPENVLMRVECEGNMHTALIFKDDAWQYESGEPFKSIASKFKVMRFRPWIDPDEEEQK